MSRYVLPQIGELIEGRYRIERVLGEGGMGVVFAARHEAVNKRVAIKVLQQDAAWENELVARFLREARASAQLESDHTARLIDYGTLQSGLPYMVLELLEGESFAERVARGPLPIQEAVAAILQACEGLAEAHALGIIHRDLKPANLFATNRVDGRPLVKVLDFGVAKVRAADHVLTTTQAAFGSPQYMSPEQLTATRDADARSDIWSLGVTLYELIAGHPPFTGTSVPALHVAIMTSTPTALDKARHDVPKALSEVVARCLAKSPAGRYPSVLDLAVALEPFAGAAGVGTAVRVRHVLAKKSDPSSFARHAPQVIIGTEATQAQTQMQMQMQAGNAAVPAAASRARRVRAIGFSGAALGALLLVAIVTMLSSTRTEVAEPPATPPPANAAPLQVSSAAVPLAATALPDANRDAEVAPAAIDAGRKRTPRTTAIPSAEGASRSPDRMLPGGAKF